MRRHHTAQINCAFLKVRRRKVGMSMRMAAKRADITTKTLEQRRKRQGARLDRGCRKDGKKR